MDETPAEFELVEFEQVEAAPGTVLLRIAARPSPAVAAQPLTLVIGTGEDEYRCAQLPSLPDPPGLIRAAFSAPLDQVGRGVSFALELPNRTRVQLPAPSRRRTSMATATRVVNGDGTVGRPRNEDALTSRLADAESRAEARRLAIAELERRLQAERQRRHVTEADIARLRADRNRAYATRDDAILQRDEAVSDREMAEARARVLAAKAGTLDAQIRSTAGTAERARTELERKLTEKDDEVVRIREAAELAQARAHASRMEAAELDQQLAHAQAQVAVLENILEERGADAQVTYAELGVAQREIEALRRRGDELEVTVVQLGGVLAMRAAEIDLLRGSMKAPAANGAVAAENGGGQQLRLELVTAGLDEVETARAEVDLLRAQLLAEKERLTVIEAAHHETKVVLQAETTRRERAEEALVVASAERLLVSESLALEASAREQVEDLAHQLSDEREKLESQKETLFARLADEHAQAEARIELLRQLT